MESPRGICKYCKEQMPRRERVARHEPNPARAQVHATGGPAGWWFNSVYNMYFVGICPLGFFHFQGAGVGGVGGEGGEIKGMAYSSHTPSPCSAASSSLRAPFTGTETHCG